MTPAQSIINNLFISDAGVNMALPDWARAAIEIGYWARYAASVKPGRLVVCCVVPCRQVFSTLIGFGSVWSGARLFQGGLTWDALLNMEPGSEIFWKQPQINQRFSGVLEGREDMYDQTFVRVRIVKGPRKQVGAIWRLSEISFNESTLSEEQLPTSASSDRFARVMDYFSRLGVPRDSSWFSTAGTEVRFICSRASFSRNMQDWGLSYEEFGDPIQAPDLLLSREEGNTNLAKTRLCSYRTQMISQSAVTILDGPTAFNRFQEVSDGSLVILLDREELMGEHVNFLLDLQNERSESYESTIAAARPRDLPQSIEVTAYGVHWS